MHDNLVNLLASVVLTVWVCIIFLGVRCLCCIVDGHANPNASVGIWLPAIPSDSIQSSFEVQVKGPAKSSYYCIMELMYLFVFIFINDGFSLN